MSGDLHEMRRRHRVPALALAAVVAIGAAPAPAAIPAAERQALINLYTSTHGGGWASNAGWCSGSCPASGTPAFNSIGSECGWYGITCDAGLGHVVAIALPGNRLSGSLPDLSALTGLRYLSAASNQLSGPLPALAALTNLQAIYLSKNAVSGSIPALTGLAELAEVGLGDNQFGGAIPSLSGLTALISFDVAGNQLTGSIPSLAGLSKLRVLDVSRNALGGSLPSLAASGLLRLAADHNLLTGAIPSLPASLTDAQLGYNRLAGSVPAAPAALYTPLVFVPSTICPNPLTTAASGNDAGWNAATGFSAWWQNPYPGNRCDDLFAGSFD
jgi:hypothetical protein